MKTCPFSAAIVTLCCFTLCSTEMCLPGAVTAQEFDEKFDHWPVDFKLKGRIVLANRASNVLEDEVAKYFLRAAGGEAARIVVIALRELGPDEPFAGFEAAAAARIVCSADADTRENTAPAVDQLEAATGVALLTDKPLTPSQRGAIQQISGQLQGVVQRGGVVYADNQCARLLSQVEITGGDRLAQVSDGLNLVPDSVIAIDFATEVARRRVRSVLVAHPRTVAIGLASNTAVVLDGRILRVLGDGQATVMVGASERSPFRRKTIQAPANRRQAPNDFLIDLTQWRRMAHENTLDTFPPAEPRTPQVENGTLVIVGGGGMPENLMQQFVDLAGGQDAKLVYVPCSEAEHLTGPQRTVEGWKKLGVRHATFIHTKDRRQANDDETFLAPLKEATGVWFGGGRQWNFADSYYGTTAHKLMKDVLKRGGVIGGSSAGASIQARYLARATPINNVDLMAPGYERGGLGFISGVAIDQHFSQRGRQQDMTQLVDRYPQLLGIGIDEATGLVVQGSVAEVVGRGNVHFYDRNLPVYPDRPDYLALPAGSRYDLAAREIIRDARETDHDKDESAKTTEAADH